MSGDEFRRGLPQTGDVRLSNSPSNEKPRKPPLGVPIFPKLPDAPTFKCKPWRLSDEARAAIEEIEAHQRRSWREVMTGNFWLD